MIKCAGLNFSLRKFEESEELEPTMETDRSRKRPSGGADLQLHQEAQQLHQEAQQPPGCKRRCREDPEEMNRGRRRSRGGCKENRDPGAGLRRGGTQNLQRDRRWASQARTRTRTTACTGAAFSRASEVKAGGPEVRVALIRKTRIQLRGSSQTQDRQPRTNSKVRSTAGSRISSEQDRGTPRTWSVGRATETRARRRRKIHPSVFRGRGQLRLSITAAAGKFIIDIHEAQGLMGKSCGSCDSYVKIAVTSNLDHRLRMKTQTVQNNKNPEYGRSFTLPVTGELLLSRLLVSVFRRSADSRCSQLIGCMSFGLGSVVSSPQPITGWFYLLGEEYGCSKHLRVTSQQRGPMRSTEEAAAGRLADLRRTPDSAPDSDLNRVNNSTDAVVSKCVTASSTSRVKDVTAPALTSSLDPVNANYSSYGSTLYSNTIQHPKTQDGSSTQRLMVSIVRGKDGFGFTICSDCPVRVQAVDPRGPAHQSGLRQGDSVLQLNGHPVETWKCADLAHAIRTCPSQIVLVVWRGLPDLRSGCEALLRPPTHSTMTGRKLLSQPSHSKQGHRRGQRFRVRSSLGALSSLWRDRKDDQEEEEEEEEMEDQEVFSPHTTTLKGTHVTSSNGDNYIILSPVNSGGQLLQPVYHDRNGTIGRLYQTHPSRGQNLLHDPRLGSSRRQFASHTSTLPPPPSTTTSSSAPPRNYGDYQNCTIVQSHLPCSGYGPCVSMAPKTLIFPIFVQPLDLCSPDRTLLMSEEMVLHQASLLPAKVTVLIYSDLMLLTREDEAGCCNVLQSPLYLNTLQLREVSSEPMHIYFLQSSQSCWRCLFSLEAFSIEQKVRVSLCLHDNIQLRLVTTETGHSHQTSGLPLDFGLLSLGRSDLLYGPSSPYSSPCATLRPPSPSPYPPSSPLSSSAPPPLPFSSLSSYTTSSPPSRTVTSLHPPPSSSIQRSPVWKERAGAEDEEETRERRGREEEERQQGEGESASETSEIVGGVKRRSLLFGPTHFNMREEEEEEEEEDSDYSENTKGGGDAEELTFRPAVLRRSLSEGSLLHEPRSPRFLSDSTIHRLTHRTTLDLDPGPAFRPPSPHTLRKQLTSEGGSLHHMLLLLNGVKGGETRNHQLRKKTKSLAADVRSRLAFLRRRKNSVGSHGNSLEKALRNNRPSVGQVLQWAESLEALMTNQYGLAVFRHFLRSEFSEENLDFWLAVERFKRTRPLSKMAARAMKVYEEFISTNAARQVNVDSAVRELTNQSLQLGVSPASFQLAQDQIFSLMETDSYPRFLKSRLYAQLANYNTQTDPANQGEALSRS
ncbi:regulator of G-protein signaling 3-like isoform X2 [Parambassis ranga]|uniref:Regulator of G-protein signaling 3-like isoform X2 n=1 Tax=Parambassis ranga TaxID=210632 RepID=A0A6P7J0B2_9TELE|nr:regulator of G-protein signaling 3-like isoform X2 [Parambassis ranga]